MDKSDGIRFLRNNVINNHDMFNHDEDPKHYSFRSGNVFNYVLSTNKRHINIRHNKTSHEIYSEYRLIVLKINPNKLSTVKYRKFEDFDKANWTEYWYNNWKTITEINTRLQSE